MEKQYRTESDSVGSMQIEADAVYGIQSLRGKNNFDITGLPMRKEFVDSLMIVKKAAARANGRAGVLSARVAEAIACAADDVLGGKAREAFIVDPVQGGAGTSANMNANEVLANLACAKLGGRYGDYAPVHPNDHVNCGQSTNDVIPTAGKMTVLTLSKPLLAELDALVRSLDRKAEEFDGILKMGRTQLQDAVPMRLGQSFRAFASAVTRGKTRLEKSLDEMRVINIGGTAIGSGITADPVYFATVVDTLSDEFGERFVRPADLFDATQNIDGFAAVSGALKALAVALSKTCNDLRLLASGPKAGLGEIVLPPKQNGSSIMPGKINPVIPEVVNQVAFLVVGHDVTIAMAAEAGQLELNAFEPVVFYQLFESITALTGAVNTLRVNCIDGIVANEENCQSEIERSVGIVTALTPFIGYKIAASVAKESLRTGKSVKQIALARGLLSEQKLDEVLDARAVTEPPIA